MIKEQTKYIAVNPEGKICGPIGETVSFVVTALEYGHSRAGGSGDINEILNLGYSVYRAKITPEVKINLLQRGKHL